MGQAYSTTTSNDRYSSGDEAPPAPADSTPIDHITGRQRGPVEPARHSRFLPYPLFSRRRRQQQRRQRRPVVEQLPEQVDGGAPSARMSVDSIRPESQDSGDVHMGVVDDESSQAQQQGGGWQRSRVRMRAGNELLSRIISRPGVAANDSDSDMMAGTNFRMFLLPGAIEQALETYEREHGAAAAAAAAVHDGGSSEDGREAAAAAAAAAAEPASVPAAVSGGVGQHPRELNEDERRRAERQRTREEKLQQLRNITEAMRDGRRNVQFPVMMLGVRMNPMLHQQTRAVIEAQDSSAIGSAGGSAAGNPGGSSSSSSSSTSSMAVWESQDSQAPAPAGEEQTVESPTESPTDEGMQQEQQQQDGRGFLSRMSDVLPNILDLVSSLRRVHDAAAATAPPALPDSQSGGLAEGSGQASADSDDSSTSQPGMAVFIMIHFMNLGNPVILPLVTHTLFPELISDSVSSTPADAVNMRAGVSPPSSSSSSGANYDLFLEITNIIGQVTATTVTQDIVDKKLADYRFAGSSVARLVGGGGEIQLVSGEQCPVCLEEFAEGDLLRVLRCHHGLHKVCGDSWFTQGANKCPICRSEAVVA
ncbi:hypothetical protein GGF46_001965 [Coemansia sp. RSA 552]|nr:hypothetical protein GGF46_001965 [Coemansia sp. RSA 552]